MISNISGSYKKIFRKSFMYKSCFGINIIKKMFENMFLFLFNFFEFFIIIFNLSSKILRKIRMKNQERIY